MLPGDELSSKAHIAGFAFPVKTPGDFMEDWEQGGIALNDPSEGLEVQLWHLQAKYNETTGNVDCIVEAPSVAPTVLFSGVDISEVALAFDQNMNPFVAYIEGGIPKIYWFDPLIPGMTHTTLPTGCYDLRCTLDDKRDFAVSDSDIVLGYINASNLCVRYQSDRYLIEHVLKVGVGGDANLVSMAMNSQWRLQFRLRNYALTDDPGALLQADPFLADVVADLLRRSDVPPEHIDTNQLWVPIEGYRIANEGGADSNIAPLQAAWFFDPGEWDKKLRFIMRGAEPVAHITYEDLLEREGITGPMEMERVQEVELLRKVNVTMVDSTAGWIANKQTAERRSATIRATGESSTVLPITASPDFTATVATKRLRIPWGEPHKFKYGLGTPWSSLTPTDVITYEDRRGRVYQIRLGQSEEDYGNFQFEAQTNARWVYGITTAGASAKPWIPTVPGQAGNTVIEILNAPVQRETDDELGLYIAPHGTGDAWNGGVLLVSTDGGANYVQAATFDVPATVGTTTSTMTDSSTSVNVVVRDPLQSVTDDQIAAGYNRMFIDNEEMQFKTALLTSHDDSGYHYTLSGIVRHVLRTPAVAHASGARFVFFDDSVVFVPIGRTYYDTDIKYKGVTLGQNADDVAANTYHLKPMYSQIEWAVHDVVVTAAAGGGITVAWQGSPRIGTFGANPYHSKYMTGYRVKFSDGHTIDTTEQTVTYAAGLMGTVVEVRALNAITGEGPLANGTGDVDPVDVPTFGFSGSFPDGFKGIPYILYPGDHGITMSGGYWDANARGIVVPGVGAKCAGSELGATRFVGIPYQTGVHTSKVRVDASSPAPGGSGSSDINQSVNVLARPTYGLLDLRFRDHEQYSRIKLEPSSPPWKKFTYSTPGTLFFYGVTSGKVCGQVILTGTDDNVLLGIDELRAPLGISTGIAVGVNKYSTAAKEVRDGTYSIELDCGTGNFWMYKDGTGLIHSGNVPLAPGKVYHICVTNEHEQTFTAEFNGGNEAWFMPVTQVGHGGIPVPAFDIPIAWGTVSPDYSLSLNGDGLVGALYADDPSGTALARANASYSSGRYRWIVESASSHGICVAAFNETHGLLGSAGSPDSAGVYVDNNDNHTLMWCFGGVTGNAALTPLTGNYLSPVMALDADSDTLKVYYMDHFGTPVLAYSLAIPTGQTWDIVARVSNGAFINRIPPPPITGYADAIVP